MGPSFYWPHADEQLRALIWPHADEQLRALQKWIDEARARLAVPLPAEAVPASNRLTVQYANAPTIKKDLTVEVEEAMRWFNDVLSLLESINIRIDETDAPHVAVIRAALAPKEKP
jgi:hypothetical protein